MLAGRNVSNVSNPFVRSSTESGKRVSAVRRLSRASSYDRSPRRASSLVPIEHVDAMVADLLREKKIDKEEVLALHASDVDEDEDGDYESF